MPSQSPCPWLFRCGIAACWSWIVVWGMLPSVFSQTVSIDQSNRGKYLSFSSLQRVDAGDLKADLMIETGHAMLGYHRVHFRVRPSKLGRFSESGELELRLSNYDYNSGGTSGHIVTIPLLAGELEARQSALICFDLSSYQVRLQATLNGRSLPGLSTYIYSDQRQWYGNSSGQASYLTLISEDTSRLSGPRRNAFQSIERLSSQSNTGNWYQVEQFVSQMEMGFGVIERLPKNWLEISHFSTIQIDGQDFLELTDEANQILMQYVRAGGLLSIQRVDQPDRVWSKLAEKGVPRYLPFSNATNPKKSNVQNDPSLQTAAKFRATDFVFENGDLLPETPWDDFIETLMDEEIQVSTGVYRAPSIRNYSLGAGMGTPLSMPIERWMDDTFIPVFMGLLDQQANFVNAWSEQLTQWHRLSYENRDPLQGNMSAELMEPTPAKDYRASIGLGNVYVSYDRSLRDLQAIEDGTSNATVRFANGFGAAYWEWLIPSVGKTPVWSFLLFVLVFVGLVAPALIIWTNRTGRRVWLILWMPCLAFCATSTLFAFGFVKDGFTSVSRIRSLTMMDREGNGMVWSRQAYFSAYLPRDGIRMSDQVMVTRLWPNNDRKSNQQWTREEDGEIVFAGLLPARIQSQFIVTHPVSGLRIVEKKPRSSGTASPTVVNLGRSKWQLGVFVDNEGIFYVAENIEPEQEVTLKSIEPVDAMKKLHQAYQANPLRSPTDAPLEDQRTLGDSLWGRSYYNTIAPEEAKIEEAAWVMMMGDPTSRALPSMQPPPGSFFLFTDQAPHLEKCLPNATETSSLHAITGHW